MKKIKVAVLFGGRSTEHDISIISGVSVINNLDNNKYIVKPIYVTKDNDFYECKIKDKVSSDMFCNDRIVKSKRINNWIKYLKNVDVVFPLFHGLYGEDGTIQGLLELINSKYVGCGVLSSSICMDKIYTKMIFEKAGIPQANYIWIKNNNEKYIYVDNKLNESEKSIDEISRIIEKKLKYPVFVKPSNSGSSVGVNKANNKDELKVSIKEAFKYDKKVLIEETINGREIECAVLGSANVKATIPGEIKSFNDFYSFDSKYKSSESKIEIPAKLKENEINKIMDLAIKAFKAVDGFGLSRVDFFIENKSGKILINEINTMPGFTDISMYPKLWENMGLTYKELLDELIILAINRE